MKRTKALKDLIVKNFWLKVLALFLAVLSWFYIIGELDKRAPEGSAFFKQVLPYRMVAQDMPIKINLVGKPRTGYQVLYDKITIKPSSCVILAPRYLMQKLSSITTDQINIGEFTKPIVKKVHIRPVGHGIILESDFVVDVVIPIKKIQPQEQHQVEPQKPLHEASEE